MASGGFEPPCLICHLNISQSDKNCSKDPNLHTADPGSESILTENIRSDHLIKRVDSLHILHRGLFGVLSPQNFIIHLNVKITGAKYLTTPPHFWENPPFLAPLMILWETYALV